MVSERREAELALGIVEQVDVTAAVPQRDMGVAAIAGQMHERLWHEGGAQPMLASQLLDHEFEKDVAIGGDQRVVIGPIHLELAVGVLVIALIRRPAELEHRVADGTDQLVSAQECGLVVARLRLPVGLVGDREAIHPQHEELGLDPVFIRYPLASAAAIWHFSTCRGACSSGSPPTWRSAASQPISGFQGIWIRLAGSGIANMSGSAGVKSRWVANPANAAPSRCICPIAEAGTSLARRTPNRSTKLIRK